MPKFFRNITIVLAVLILCAYSIYPPKEKFRLGRDLQGGVSLTYTVQIRPDEEPTKVLNDTIGVLKNRVDPDGVMEIQMVAAGRDRIEIAMPLPRDEVKQLRRKFEDKLKNLGNANVTLERLEQAVRLPKAERDATFAKLSGGSDKQLALLNAAAAAYDESKSLADAVAQARAAKATPEELDPLVNKAADAAVAFEEAEKKVLATVLSPADVRRALELSDRVRKIAPSRGADATQYVEIPSDRARALDRLRKEHPDATAQLDDIVASYADYAKSRRTLDDPQDLIKLLRAAGVLSFRITVNPGEHPEEARLRQELRERGPLNVRANDARWYKINQIANWYSAKDELDFLEAAPQAFFQGRGYVGERYGSDYYILAWDTRAARLTNADGTWAVAQAREGRDELGRPSISFEMDVQGASRLGDLTKTHVGKHMAVLLDDQVYTAPTLQSAISKSGQITGDFSKEERDYIIRVLGAGSLQAKLSPEPISQNVLGPELGKDNLENGMKAGLVGLVAVGGFMIVYYFGCGLVAVIALLFNALIIMGLMVINHAAFTLPGIAGMILTFGMAVDSNVLIYERMREELLRGHDLKTAVRLGFDKAFSSIVDGNIANLIICVVLGYTGTPEIRGFAITMGIGVLGTLFSALVVTRLILELLVYKGGLKRISMLPMAIPQIQSLMTPRVNWLKYRFVFLAVSASYVLLGLGVAYFQGESLLDTEFRGGTKITLNFKPSAGEGTPPLTMTRAEVEDRVKKVGQEAAQNSPLRALTSADILPINPEADGVTSSRFDIKTTVTDEASIREALTSVFADMLESQPTLTFVGSNETDASKAPIFKIINEELGANIGRSLPVARDVKAYMGGAVLMIQDISPRTSLQSLTSRLEQARSRPEFADTLGRRVELVVLAGTDDDVKSAALLVLDEAASFFDNETQWQQRLANVEWRLAKAAFTVASTPASVQQFSPAIASSFKANAVVAVLLSFLLIAIYIWVRFKSVRFSLGALASLAHDVLTVIGAVGLANLLLQFPATADFAQRLGIQAYKIDLNMIAAILTIGGYSLNDTIVLMDRIRENRGRSLEASGRMINESINQVISRTIITSGTTMTSSLIIYLFGGEGVRAFAFALVVGIFVGTYSSIAVAAPIVWTKGGADLNDDPRPDGADADAGEPALART
ncbi:MAG: protein translocase subunit SecD [Planctomycetota bacterium]|nr:protein translocase subunit SecD [Planctomycetota bacterium]